MSSTPHLDAVLGTMSMVVIIFFSCLIVYDCGRTNGRNEMEKIYKPIVEKNMEDYKALRVECVKHGFAEWKVTDANGNVELVWKVSAEKKQ